MWQMGSVLRGALRMTAAGWLIGKLELRDPIHRSIAVAGVGIGIGLAEKYCKQLQGDGGNWRDLIDHRRTASTSADRNPARFALKSLRL